MNFNDHIVKLQRDMRHAYAEFVRFDREWNELNKAFHLKVEQENAARDQGGRFRHTPLGIAQQKSDILALSDAMEAAKWWRDKAQALGTVLLAEQAARTMINQM